MWSVAKKNEKLSQLKFEDQGKKFIVDQGSFSFQTKSFVDDIRSWHIISVYPKPTERQRVQPCLKVFSEKVIVALELRAKDKAVKVSGIVLFSKKVLTW